MKKSIFLLIAFLLAFIAPAQTKCIIYFDSGKSELKKESLQVLDSLIHAAVLAGNGVISINAYCDNTGDENSNQLLSDQRAEVIRSYIQDKKIPELHLLKKGFGETLPVAENNTEKGKAKNRRAEISLKIKEEQPVTAVTAAVPEKTGPLPQQIIPNPVKSGILDANSKAEDLEEGKILVLKNLNFVGGAATLLPESKPSLKTLLRLMKENPALEIEIEGHVCCMSDMQLSIDRALTVLEYLVNNGINEKRLRYAGHSNNNPIADETTEKGRIQNRRVEIMILKK